MKFDAKYLFFFTLSSIPSQQKSRLITIRNTWQLLLVIKIKHNKIIIYVGVELKTDDNNNNNTKTFMVYTIHTRIVITVKYACCILQQWLLDTYQKDKINSIQHHAELRKS